MEISSSQQQFAQPVTSCEWKPRLGGQKSRVGGAGGRSRLGEDGENADGEGPVLEIGNRVLENGNLVSSSQRGHTRVSESGNRILQA